MSRSGAGPAVPAQEEDIPSWLLLVREVEPLFGPMPDFEQHLRKHVNRGTALCVRDSNGAVVAGMLLSTREPRIGWLAVSEATRRNGHGKALVDAALSYFDSASVLVVDTFGEDNASGRAARRLYQAAGFDAAEVLEPGPEGGSRQRFRLKRGDV